jgi:hypothetical protein
VLLKDFDAKSGFTTLGGAWWSFTDVDFPGVTQPSTMTRVDSVPAMDSTGFAARYTIRFSDESSSAAGFGCDIGPLYSGMHRAYDLSQLSGIQFDCMGDSVSVSVQLYSPLAGYSTIRKFKPQQNWARHSISMAEALAGLSAAEKDQWEQVKRFVTRFQFTIVRNEAPKQSSISVDTIVFVF